MSRDLFEATVVARQKPKRARWIVVASAVVHAGIIAVLLIGPILSATEGIVALARGVTYAVPAVPAVPQAPPSPQRSVAPAPSVDPNAAPTQPAEKPVTQEIAIGSAHSGLPEWPPRDWRGSGDGFPGPPSGAPPVKLPPPEPPPVQRPQDPIKVGGQIRAPRRIAYVAPVYPSVALAAKIEADVTIEATIDEHGVVRNVRAVRPNALFEKAAMEAVSQWRYEPTRLNGVAVPVVLTVSVSFQIKR